MITGVVNSRRQATINLEVRGPNAQVNTVVVVDTGFTGALTLPMNVIRAMGLPLVGNRRATLADGSTVSLDVYRATVIWDSQARSVLVLATSGGPLVGMSLLYGYALYVEAIDGGVVTIQALP